MLRSYISSNPELTPRFKTAMDYVAGNSGLIVPASSFVSDLPGFFYFDAVGRADEDRWWGGLLALGREEDAFLADILQKLKKRNIHLLHPKTGELKGKDLASAEIFEAFRALQGHRIYFWARKMPSQSDPTLQALGTLFVSDLAKIRPNRDLSDWETVAALQVRLREYLADLKSVNSHKFLSFLLHPVRLMDHIKSLDLGPRLSEVHVYIDNENFPEADICAWGLKWFLTSQLQHAGMSPKLTGNAHLERGDSGSVRVQANCNSAAYPGLELVDIFTHGHLRGILDLIP